MKPFPPLLELLRGGAHADFRLGKIPCKADEVVIDEEGYSSHRHYIPTWNYRKLTFSYLYCYKAAIFAALGGIIEALTILFNTHSTLDMFLMSLVVTMSVTIKVIPFARSVRL